MLRVPGLLVYYGWAMPGEASSTERDAMALVRSEEVERGWRPGRVLSQARQPIEGCVFLSEPPGGGQPHPVEVKGWGEPLLRRSDQFSYPADINVEQLERAGREPNWRLEIVGNLTAARHGTGQPERLTLTAREVVERATGWKYKVPLDGRARRVRESGGEYPVD